MAEIAVLHASRHGTARRYAEWIAAEFCADPIDVARADPTAIARADTVVVCAAIYGPQLVGASFLKRAMDLGDTGTHWILVTVGMSDPALTDRRDVLVRSILGERAENLDVFHVRGRLDRADLSVVERGILRTISFGLGQLHDRSPEDEAMLEILRQPLIDLTSPEQIEPVIGAAANCG